MTTVVFCNVSAVSYRLLSSITIHVIQYDSPSSLTIRSRTRAVSVCKSKLFANHLWRFWGKTILLNDVKRGWLPAYDKTLMHRQGPSIHCILAKRSQSKLLKSCNTQIRDFSWKGNTLYENNRNFVKHDKFCLKVLGPFYRKSWKS